MLNFGKVKFTREQLEILEKSVENYHRHAKLSIVAVPLEDSFTVIATQFDIPANGKILTWLEIVDRVQDMFKDFIPVDLFVITPQPYER